jgi:hypothetical protein
VRRWVTVAGKIALAEVVLIGLALILTFGVGPRTRHAFAVWVAISAFALLTVGTGAIYGGELRRVNDLRAWRPRNRFGLPPLENAEVGPEAHIEDRPPRLRAMVPALVAFLIGMLIAFIIGVA